MADKISLYGGKFVVQSNTFEYKSITYRKFSIGDIPLKTQLYSGFLFCQAFLYCNRASHAFIEPKKHLCRCFWVFGSTLLRKDNARSQVRNDYFVSPSCTATAHATEAPTIGLLPIPIRPIISTCAGTDDEPANCASECILPIVSVMP